MENEKFPNSGVFAELQLLLSKAITDSQDPKVVQQAIRATESAHAKQLDHQRGSANDLREFRLRIFFASAFTLIVVTYISFSLIEAPADKKMDAIESIGKIVAGAVGGLAGGFALGHRSAKHLTQ